jgi:hypothetical protein
MSGGTFVTFYNMWDICHLLAIGGTNVRWHLCHGSIFVTFYNRWDKCHLLAIGGTNISFLVICGTNVDLIEGGTNVRWDSGI